MKNVVTCIRNKQYVSKKQDLLRFQTIPTNLVQCQQFTVHRIDIKIFTISTLARLQNV